MEVISKVISPQAMESVFGESGIDHAIDKVPPISTSHKAFVY